jgi:hypothetical protein
VGNHPGATGGPVPAALPDERPQTTRERADVVRETIVSDPAGTLDRRLAAGVAFFLGEDWLRPHPFHLRRILFEVDESAGLPQRAVDYCRVLLPATLLLLFLLAGLGWRWSYAARPALGPAALAVIVIPLPYLLGHAESLSGPRLPLDGVLICFAAYAVMWMIAGLADGYRPAPD